MSAPSPRKLRAQRLAGLREVWKHYEQTITAAAVSGTTLTHRRRNAADLRYFLERETWRAVTPTAPKDGAVVHVFIVGIGNATAKRSGDVFTCTCGCAKPLPAPLAWQYASPGPYGDRPDPEPTQDGSGSASGA